MGEPFLERLAKGILVQTVKSLFKALFRKKQDSTSPSSSSSEEEEEPNKVHPWRRCGAGRHWVVTHPLTVPVSEKNPDGKVLRGAHCADNPIRKKGLLVHDYMDKDEIHFVAENAFSKLTDQAIKALSDVKGEIKDHYVKITTEETSDPNMSICAGIRWIFHKQRLASNDLKREASWIEAVEKYKGALNKSPEVKQKQLSQFYKVLKELKADYHD